MNMKKMFAGLIALVAGLALSAGSALATKGYMGGDPAMMKLVPYYETGDNRATIIGIQNLSPQEMSTEALHQDVADLKAYLAGEAATANITDDTDGLIPGLDADAVLLETDLNGRATAEQALADAEMAAYTEHLFITVNVYDAMGMMMDNASATLCLAEHQFGVVVLQGSADTMMMDNTQKAVLSVMDGDIPEYGWVKIIAENRKFTGCGATAPNTLMNVVLDTPGDATTLPVANSMIAAWTIIQDVGDGFFGTEVPTTTIMLNAKVGDADMAEIACYATPAQTVTDGAAATADANTNGLFDKERCGMIPERHNNASVADDESPATLAPFTTDTTPRGHAFARYDAGDESMVVVWLAKGADKEDTRPSARRMLDVVVKCEDGSVMMASDIDGNMSSAKVHAPNMITMIDPTMGAVGELTDMCEGDRGTLQITMPDGSNVGMAFSHITQMMGHYRMNFPGYNMASITTCATAGGTEIADQRAACMAP